MPSTTRGTIDIDGGIPYVNGNNDRDQLVGDGFDFNTQRWVGYIAELPLKRDND